MYKISKLLSRRKLAMPQRGLFAAAQIGTPNRLFWVGGSGNWSDRAHWARRSGGSGGVGVPTITQNVTIDASSGTAATITIDVAATAKSVTITKSDITIIDNAGMTVSGIVTLNAGTLNTNGKTENWGSFAAPTTTLRTLNITNSTINITTPNSTVWNISSVTNLTATLTGSTLNFTGASAGFAGQQTLTYPNVNFLIGGAINHFSGSFVNLTVLGHNSILFDDVMGVSSAGLTVTGTFTVTGFAQNQRFVVFNTTAAGPISITAAAVALTNVEFQNINGAGAATWTGTVIGDDGGNTNITFTPPTTYFWIGNAGTWADGSHWSLTSGGAPSGLVPLPQDTALFDANSFTLPGQQVDLFYSEYSNIDFTGVTNNPDIRIRGGANFCGNITLSPNMTTSTDGLFNRMTFFQRGGTGVITCNGTVFAAGLAVSAVGGTLRLADNLAQPSNVNAGQGGITLIAGTFDANNKNVLLYGGFVPFGSLTKVLLMGSGIWTLATANGTIWNGTGTGMTLTASTSTIKVQGTPTGTRTFAGGGQTYNNFEWAAEGVASTLIMTGANIFSDLKVDADTVARTLTLPSSVTQTSTTIEMNGSAGKLLTVNSSIAGTRATLSQAIGTVAATYLSLKDSNATGGAVFAATTSVDNGNNAGWAIS